jgi:DNA-binding response OmpR family regulator
MSPSLLLADADEYLSGLYREYLERHGYHVEAARGGLECLDKLRASPPGVLVLSLDLLWGGADGVLARMRENSDLPRVPVILLVGAGRPDGSPPHLSPPVVRLLRKPFRLGDLLESVRSAALPG